MLSSSFGDISLTKYRISGVVLFSFDGVVSLLQADSVYMLALNRATPGNYFFQPSNAVSQKFYKKKCCFFFMGKINLRLH